MSIPKLIYERKIGFQFAVAISNGDCTGLTEDEDLLLDDWYSRFGKNDYAIATAKCDKIYLAKCDITGLYSECVSFCIYRMEE